MKMCTAKFTDSKWKKKRKSLLVLTIEYILLFLFFSYSHVERIKTREFLRQGHKNLVNHSVEPIDSSAWGIESSLSFSFLFITIAFDRWWTRGKRGFLINNIKKLYRKTRMRDS
jgi:hypothetical protein